MRLRILSPGEGVTVTHALTGEPLEGVRRVAWSCDAEGVPEAVIVLKSAALDVVVDEGRRPFDHEAD